MPKPIIKEPIIKVEGIDPKTGQPITQFQRTPKPPAKNRPPTTEESKRPTALEPMHVYPHEKPELKLRTAQRYEAESKTAEQAALDKFESSNSGRKPIISVGAEKLNTFHGQQPVKVLPDEIVEVRVGGPVPRVPLLYPGISVRYVGSISATA